MTERKTHKTTSRPLWQCFARHLIHLFSRLGFRLLTRLTLTGRERIPTSGGLILAANHADMIDIPMLAVFAGRQVEILGTNDVPLHPFLDGFMKVYGYIPIRRGSFDRKALQTALDVLASGGCVGIFPEGGLWDDGGGAGGNNAMAFRSGVAWLSHKAGVPVLPIAFAGTRGGVGRILRFERPVMQMHTGEILSPPKSDGHAPKADLEAFARLLNERITALLPEDQRQTATSSPVTLRVLSVESPETPLFESELLGHFFYNTKLAEILAMHFKAAVYVPADHAYTPSESLALIDALLRAIDDNPAFFDYRMGRKKTLAFTDDLHSLAEILAHLPPDSPAVRFSPSASASVTDHS